MRRSECSSLAQVLAWALSTVGLAIVGVAWPPSTEVGGASPIVGRALLASEMSATFGGECAECQDFFLCTQGMLDDVLVCRRCGESSTKHFGRCCEAEDPNDICWYALDDYCSDLEEWIAPEWVSDRDPIFGLGYCGICKADDEWIPTGENCQGYDWPVGPACWY